MFKESALPLVCEKSVLWAKKKNMYRINFTIEPL